VHPTTSYDLAAARAAELRSQAQRDALARHARTHKPEHAAPRLAAAGAACSRPCAPAAPDSLPHRRLAASPTQLWC